MAVTPIFPLPTSEAGPAANPATTPVSNQGNPGMPPKSPPTAALTPDQMGQIGQIAQAIGIEPDRLMADLQTGLLPGGFDTLTHLLKDPKALANFKAHLGQAEKTQV